MKGCFTTLLLALIAAFIAAFFGRSCHQQRVEEILTERVASQIETSYPGVNVRYDHLTAMVSGSATATEIEEIKAKVKELTLGNGRVYFDLSAPTTPTIEAPNFTIFRDGNNLTLNGTVDSAQSKAILGRSAAAESGGMKVTNNLEVGANTAEFPAFGQAVAAVPALVKVAGDAKIEATPEKVTVSGTVESQSIKNELLGLFSSAKWNNAEVVDLIKVVPPKRITPSEFTVRRSNEKLTLTGLVDSEDTRTKIGNAAKVDGVSVDNQIKISNKVMKFPALAPTLAGIPALINSAQDGKIEVKPEKVTISGLVDNQAAKKGIVDFYTGNGWNGPRIDERIKIRPNKPPGFVISRNQDKLVLTGLVDSQRTKNMLGNAARLEGVTVDNQIKISDEVMTFPEFNPLLAGIPSLIGSAKNGKIEVDPRQIKLSGQVDTRNTKKGVLDSYSVGKWKLVDNIKIKPSIPPAFAIQRSSDKLVLTGTVDSPATKMKLGNAAKMEGLTIDNQIKVNEEVMTFPEFDSTLTGIPVMISAAQNGKIDVTPEKMTLSGNVDDQTAKDALMSFYNSPDWKGPEIDDRVRTGAAPTKPPAFVIARANKKLTLTGTVDSEATRMALGNAAKVKGVTVDNQLKVSADVKEFPAMDETVAGIPSLVGAATNGKIEVKPDKVTLTGLVNSKDIKDGIAGNFPMKDWKGPAIDNQIKVRPPKTPPTFAWKQDSPKKALLTGKVPNAKIRDAIVASAKKRLGSDAEVIDKMTIDSNVRNDPWLSALPVFADQALPKVDMPVINIDSKTSSIKGLVSDSTVMNDVSLAFSGINPPGKLDIDLSIMKPKVMASRTVVPDVAITGKNERLMVKGKVPNQKTLDMIVNTILGVDDLDHLDKKSLKVGEDVKEENYLEPFPSFVGQYFNGSIKDREVWLKNEELTLRGVVPSKEAKAKAIALADPLKKRGIKVIDLLTIETPAKTDQPKMAANTTNKPAPKVKPMNSKPSVPEIVMNEKPTPKVKAPDKIKPAPLTQKPVPTKQAPSVDPSKGEVYSVYFGTGEYHMRSSENSRAKKLLSRAKETSGKIIIDGFADERGTDKLNAYLSDKRAKRIRTYLMENGIAESRIVSVVGRGEVPNGNSYREYRRTDVRIMD